MIFNLVKASTIIKKSSRLPLGWLVKPRQAVNGRHSQGSTAGGMFGLLVAGDDAHRR